MHLALQISYCYHLIFRNDKKYNKLLDRLLSNVHIMKMVKR